MFDRGKPDETEPFGCPPDPGGGPAPAPAPSRTGDEERFYKHHMLLRTPMVVLTTAGQKLIGWIEWYDRDVVKLHSMTEPNRFIPKARIKYIYRHEEDPDFVEPIPTPPPLVALPERPTGRRDH
ncbi:MAG: hypothetical protein ACE5IK_11460 [Acidobacteriota bacterium]